MGKKLAILGGKRTIVRQFSEYITIEQEEKDAAMRVVNSTKLSGYYGSWSPEFYGGSEVQKFEQEWGNYFGVKYVISCNSATSGLVMALGAIGLEPGDEVIVSPWTMAASATSILFWNAIPVFADIEDETFNIDPVSIEKNITEYTKAIVVPDIFGHSADIDRIKKISIKYNLAVIEDAAQSPGAMYKGSFVGTNSDVGVFSLNYHKHIHSGEGGVCVTDDESLALRMQLIRNHAEAVVGDMGVSDLINMIGANYRLTEIQASIASQQLIKLDSRVLSRVHAANRLTDGLKHLEGILVPCVRDDSTHVYYVYALRINIDVLGVSRDAIVRALQGEGVDCAFGSYSNLHLLPIFQKRIAYGSCGFPWSSDVYRGDVSYEKGICPVAEKLQDEQYVGIELCMYRFDDSEVDLILSAFYKVWDNIEVLKSIKC